MQSYVVTGGIATGKTTVMDLLRSLCADNVGFFDADEIVREFLALVSTEQKISELLAFEGFKQDENFIKRDKLREIFYLNAQFRRSLEDLVQPEVKKEWERNLTQWEKKGKVQVVFADIPLYYELESQYHVDQQVVVAVSDKVQYSRLKQRFDEQQWGLIPYVLERQLPWIKKAHRAKTVFWNQGSVDNLQEQMKLFLKLEQLI